MKSVLSSNPYQSQRSHRPSPRSVLPEALETIRRQLRVAHGVHDVLVAEVMLEGPRIPPVIGEFVSAGMPEHVRMDRELELGSDCQTRQHFAEAGCCHRRPALGHEHVTTGAIFPL